MIGVDHSTASAVAYCHECSVWREVRRQLADALWVAADHALRVHHEPKRARELRQLANLATRRDQRG